MRTLLLVFLCGVYAIAQISTGTIVGSVTDPSGAVLAGAKISMRHSATGEVREISTNDRGEFTAAYLRLGEYSLTAASRENSSGNPHNDGRPLAVTTSL